MNLQKHKVQGGVIDMKEKQEEDEEIEIDFSKIKNIFKKKNKKQKTKPLEEKTYEHKTNEKEDEIISIDTKATIQFFKKYGTLFLILIPIFLSIWFRAYPIYLPATDDWAENTINNNIKSNIQQTIEQQYPTLPDANKKAEVEKQF